MRTIYECDKVTEKCYQRNDSLDGMTKRPFKPNQDSHDHPGVKRLRTEETVILPARDGSGGSICVRDSSYDSRAIYKPLPEIFMVDPCSQRNARVPPIQSIGEFDDPDIDLTDGPVSVNVALCQRQFYLSHFKKSYAMRRIPRGQALIINVNEVEGKLPRRGTNIDRDNLHNLLTQLHFCVTVYNDVDKLTADEIGKKLQQFSLLEDHVQADCCVVCLLSHGEEGYLFGTDGNKLKLDDIFALFDNNSCKSLIGKPKIFFIQACRGGALDEGVEWKQADEIDGSHPSMRQLPTMSDMLICYPTQSGYYAWRNRERGSWYIEALVQILMKYAKNEDMCTMLNRVNQLVSRKISRCPQIEMDQMSQMSEYKSTLRKPHLFFFPGIGSV
ncbi:caspase-2-like [Pecten maximus]|uniref:caspase-2-like n=1 Tax=Pecten maximus TaxID=6579 RepID=UPI0014581622|nr:caspase-2-like [Pecten maximus]